MTSLSPALAPAVICSVSLMMLTVALQARVIGQLRARTIGIGDGRNRELARAIRVHGNIAGNSPFLMVAMALLARVDAPALLAIPAGLLAVVGRMMHAWGFSQTAGASFGRVAGMILIFTAMNVAMPGLLYRLLG